MGHLPASDATNKGHKPYQLRYQLQESNDRYALVAKATNDVIYDLNIASGIVIWNDTLYSKYGYSEHEPVASVEWWTSHIHPDDAMRVEREFGELIDNNQDTWQSEYRFCKANGEYAVVRDRAYVLRDHDGAPKRIIGSMLDITETAKLNRAKDEFTSLVSHQLRTPLTVIQLYSAMLEQGIFGSMQPDQLEHVHRINEATDRLIKLVGDILNISRIEMDRMQLHNVETNLNDFIRLCIAQVKPLAAERAIELKFASYRAAKPLPLDPAIFGEVIQNLLTNAIRYSPDSSTIEVAVKGRDQTYVISIADHGIGIPVKDQPHIFERFYRASNAQDTAHDGTGLGLYLAKLIMENVGGQVDFTSRPSQGTTFYVTLPMQGMTLVSGLG